MDFKIKEIKTDLNALDIYYKFKDEKNTILLDSSKEDKHLSKYSFIGVNPFLVFESKGNAVKIDGIEVKGKPFDVLEGLLSKYSIEFPLNIDIPFLAGCIGYVAYDTARILEKIPEKSIEDINIPDMRFVFYDNIIILDLLNNKKYLTAIGMKLDPDESLSNLEEKIKSSNKINKINIESNSKFYSNFSKEQYKNAIKLLKEYILSGDVYIANMTQRFYTHSKEEAINTYTKLREINKAPFSAYLNFEDFQIVSSSPERFIQVKDRKVSTRPIKGTRPRGETEQQDKINRIELQDSEKDRAELLMVVDLERNDLSKVCKKNTVKVTDIFKIEEYATVFHLVASIEGVLKDEVSAVRCLKECFPGGSITGTPKIRAMEIIEELEGLKRNIYTGSIGYFDLRGNADFNIVIRSIIKYDDIAYFGVGGGITFDSIEEDEYNETLDKAKALMKVL